MTLSLLKPEHFTAEQNQASLSQWFTPEALADRVTGWAWPSLTRPARVLEPACGDGAFVRAALRRGGIVHAFEIDPTIAARALELAAADGFPEGKGWTGPKIDDYLTTGWQLWRHDLALLNPPYEGGADGRFLARVMEQSDRVAGVFRTAVLDGKERRDLIWSHVESGEWILVGVAHLGRIAFRIPTGRKPQSASTDFVAIKMRRRRPEDGDAVIGTHMEWWT